MSSIQWVVGIKSALRMVWMFCKILFPITFIVNVLQYTPIIDWVGNFFAPILHWIGLPGEAAIPFVLGNIIGLYASVGSILTIESTVKELLILSVMLGFSHNLFVEGIICKKVGVSMLVITGIRLALAFSIAVLINLMWTGGGETAQYTVSSAGTKVIEGVFPIIFTALLTATKGTLQFSIIIFLIMLLIQILKDLKVMDYISVRLRSSMSFFGLPAQSATTMTAGLLFGLMLGAGVIIDQARSYTFSKRELYLMLLFLGPCHAVIEDTLIFVPLGVPIWALFILRFTIPLMIIGLIAFIWTKKSYEIEYKKGRM